MSFLFSPHLSQFLMNVLEVLISLQIIKISIYVSKAYEVIFLLFGTIISWQKIGCNWSGPVFFVLQTNQVQYLRVQLQSLNIYISLDWLQLPVSSFWRKKLDLTELENTNYAQSNNFNTGFCNSLELLLCLHSPKQLIYEFAASSQNILSSKTSNSKYVDSQACWHCSHNISYIMK